MGDPRLNPQSQDDPEKKKVLNLYAAFGISLILSLVPNQMAALVSTLFMLGVLIAAYMMRRNVEIHGLAGNHCTYIIRTIWIGALFSLITIAITSLFMLPRIDYSDFQPCADAMAEKGAEYISNASQAEIMALSEPCMDNFIASNWDTFTLFALFGIGPILLYFIIRFVRGLGRATKGYRLADPKAWF